MSLDIISRDIEVYILRGGRVFKNSDSILQASEVHSLNLLRYSET